MLRRRCCFISEDSLPHPPPPVFPYISRWVPPPSLEERALPVSDLAPSYLSFLPSVPVLVVSPGPTFIARCGICDSSGTDCSSDVFVPDPTFVLSSALPFHSFSLIRPSLTLSSLSLRSFSPLLFPHRASCNLATGPDNSFSSLRLPSTFVSSTFCTDCTEDESEDIFVPDVVSDRKAFLSNLTAPGQLEHSFSEAEVIVFASAHFLSLLLSFLLEISTGKINTGRFLPSTKDRVWSFDDVAR